MAIMLPPVCLRVFPRTVRNCSRGARRGPVREGRPAEWAAQPSGIRDRAVMLAGAACGSRVASGAAPPVSCLRGTGGVVVRNENVVAKARKARRTFETSLKADEALIALFMGAMNANDQIAGDELARAQHLIWSTRRFRRKSGETVGRLIDRMKQLVEEQDPATVMERGARAIPARLRPAAFALVADLLLADGRIDARERRFLQRLASAFGIAADTATDVIDVMLLKNQL